MSRRRQAQPHRPGQHAIQRQHPPVIADHLARVAWVSAFFLAVQAPAATPPTPPPEAAAHTGDSVQADLDAAGSHLHNQHPRAALEALARVARVEPDNPWLAFYRGLAQLQRGNAYLAMEQFDLARDRLAVLGDPDPQLAATIRTYRRQARRLALRVDYRAGLAYDTNVSYLGDVGADFDLVTGQSDTRFASGFYLHYAPVVTEDEALVAAVRLDHTWHCKVHDFNFQDYGVSLRYARRILDPVELSLTYEYDMTLLGNDAFLSNHALTAGLGLLWDRGDTAGDKAGKWFWPQRTDVTYGFVGRDFLFDTSPAFDRDGHIHAVGVAQRFAFRPWPETIHTGELTLGYRYEASVTEGSEYDRDSHYFYVQLGVPILNPWAPNQYLLIADKELRFDFGVNWQLDDYNKASLVDQYRRQRFDQLNTYYWALSQKLIDDPDYGQLTVLGLINWTAAQSNLRTADELAPFNYDKVVYGVQLEWSW